MAILVSAGFYTFFSYSSFEWLAVCDVILYSAALMLEFVALAVLRVKEPNLPRPFRIPGGWPVIALVILSPAAIVAFAIWSQIKEEGMTAIYLSIIGIAIGPIAYLIARQVALKTASAEPRAPE
jgi:amino acid transporter